MAVVNPGVRHAVWDGMWEACRQSRYYYAIYKRYARVQKWIVGASLLLGTSAVATLIDKVPNELLPVVAVLVASLTIWSAVGRYAEKAAVASAIHSECAALDHEFRNLAVSIDAHELDTATARSKGDALAERLRTATNKCTGVGLTSVRCLQVKAENEAEREVKARHGQTTITPATAAI